MTHARGGAGAFPAGLSLLARGESLGRSASRALSVRLLAAGDGSEVMACALQAGQFITLQSSGSALECYYLLSGEAVLEGGEARSLLGPGDSFQTENLRTPALLSATTDLHFLFVSSQPVFHLLSEGLAELMRLAEDIEVKDGYTAGHCERIRHLANALGLELGLSAAQRTRLNYAAYLHDVGKTRVPLDILRKRGPLTAPEWAEVMAHPSHGRALLAGTFMAGAGLIVEQHHERWDGSGYPLGLSGEDILLEARIVAVADSFDALTTERPYRAAISAAAAREVLVEAAGRLFDPLVVSALLRLDLWG